MPLESVPAIDALLADIEAADPGHGLTLWWLGQSAFLVKSAAGRVLLNPCIGDSWAGATRPPIATGKLQSIDVVALTAPNTSCLVAPELAEVFNTNPTAAFIVPEASRKFVAEQLGCDPAWPWGLNNGESVSFGEITVLAVRSSFCDSGRGGTSNRETLGYVVWLNHISVFYCGNLQYHADTVDFLRPLAVDFALLPIPGNYQARRSTDAFASDDAVRLARDIGTQLVVPYPLEGGAFGADDTALFMKTCDRLEQPYKILQCGERLVVPAKLRQD